jgi:TP901 family phage tail tape measure protein
VTTTGLKVGRAYVDIAPRIQEGFRQSVERDVEGGLGGLKSKLGGIGAVAGKALTAGIGGAVATGVKGVLDFTSFERQMNEVFTLLPNVSEQAMGKMTGQVKTFASDFRVLPEKVVPALYQSLSAGVPADNVFAFLETAQKAAKGGVTDLTTAVDGISSVVNAYGAETIDATKASDLMFTTVRLGKTNIAELSQSLFNVTPTAAALGVKFEDVTAALAAMTVQGVPTSVATTQMRQLFVELSKAGGETATTFEQIAGKSFKQFIAEGGNTQQALQLLEKHAKDSGVGINDLFGSVEAGSAALALTGNGTDTFTTALGEMQGSAGATDAAYQKMNRGLGPIFDGLKVKASLFAISVGEKLAPVIESLAAKAGPVADRIGQIATQIGSFFNALRTGMTEDEGSPIERVALMLREKVLPILERVVDFVKGHLRPILLALAGVFGVLAGAAAIGAVIAVVTVLATALASPVAIIAALVAGVIYAYTEFESFRNVVKAVISFFTGTVVPAISTAVKAIAAVFGSLVGWVREHWADISEAISHIIAVIRVVVQNGVSFIVELWHRFGDEILSVVGVAFEWVRGTIDNVLQVIRGIISTVLALINGDWGKAWDGVKQIFAGIWDQIVNTVRAALGLVKEAISVGLEVVGSIVKGALGGIVDFVTGMPGKIASAASGLWDGLLAGFRTVVNAIIGIWNKLDLGIHLNFEIPSWVPGVGGKGFHFDVDDIFPDLGLVAAPARSQPADYNNFEDKFPRAAAGALVQRGGLMHVAEAGTGGELLALPAGTMALPWERLARTLHDDRAYGEPVTMNFHGEPDFYTVQLWKARTDDFIEIKDRERGWRLARR